MARLVTRNAQQTLEKLRAEYYANINSILKDQYQRAIDARNVLVKAHEDGGFWDTGFGDALEFTASTVFDIFGGVFGSMGNFVTGIGQFTTKLAEDAWAVFDASDGRVALEDLAYLITSVPGDIFKGIGTAGLGLYGGVRTLLGDEDGFQRSQELTDTLVRNVNRGIYAASQLGRRIQTGESSGVNTSQSTFGSLGQAGVYVSEQNQKAMDDEIQQYIDSRYEPDTIFDDISSVFSTANMWYQKNIAQAVGNVFDAETDEGRFGQFYNKYVEPTVTSISEIIPSVALSMYAGSNNPKITQKISENLLRLAKLYFASNVYGRSYEEAIAQGASTNDAHIYGIGNAGLELATEAIGGFTFSKAPQLGFKGAIFNFLSEGFEEGVAELAQPGLSYFLNENREVDNVDPTELRQKAAFSALIGGISGGIFAGVSNLSANRGINASLDVLNRELNKKTNKRNDKKIADAIKDIETKLNAQNMPQWRKNQILSNPIYRQFVEEFELDTTPQGEFNINMDGQTKRTNKFYRLTDVGQRFAQGDFMARQGDVAIDKDGYAVGTQEYTNDYLTEVEVTPAQYDADGNITKPAKTRQIEILTNNDVSKLSQEQQDSIQWFKNRGLKVAFVRSKGRGGTNFNAFTDAKTGMIYINVNSKANIESGFKNAFAHEMHDKINDLYKNGLLNKKQFDAYNKFADNVREGKLDNLIKSGLVKFNAEAYAKQLFTKEQRKQATKDGWQNVPLTAEQQRVLAREKISAIIEQVFDNETILKRAFGQQPSVFRSIANIFAKSTDFASQLKVDQDVIPYKMLQNIQKNFQNLLRKGSEFAFGATTIVDSIMQRSLLNPAKLFSFEQGDENPFVESQEQFRAVLNDEQEVFRIIGYEPDMEVELSEPSILPKGYFTKESITQRFFRKFKPTFIAPNSRLDQELKEKYPDKDYFLKIGNVLYDRKKFQVPGGANRFSIVFVDNSYFEIRHENDGRIKTEFLEPDYEDEDGYTYQGDKLDKYVDVFEGRNVIQVRGDMEIAEGVIYEDPMSFVASINPARMNDIIEKNGLILEQSLAIQPMTFNTLNTQEFENPFIDGDHQFVMTFGFKNDIINNPSFRAYKNDAFTMQPLYETSTEENAEEYAKRKIDPTKKLLFRAANVVGYKTQKAIDFKNLSRLLQVGYENLVGNAAIFTENTLENSLGGFDFNVVSNLESILFQLDTLSKQNQQNYTKESFKKEITKANQTIYTLEQRIEIARDSINAFIDIYWDTNISNVRDGYRRMSRLETIAKMLDYTRNESVNENVSRDIERLAEMFQIELYKILEMMDLMPYHLSSISEMNLSQGSIQDVNVAVISHLGENKNSELYKKVKDFLMANGVTIKEVTQPRTIEQMMEKDNFKGEMLDFIKGYSEYKSRHTDVAESSVVKSLVDADEDSPSSTIMFSYEVDVDESSESESPKNEKDARETKPSVGVNPVESLEEHQAMQATETKQTVKTILEITDENGQTQQLDDDILTLLKLRPQDIRIVPFDKEGKQQYIWDARILNQGDDARAYAPRAYVVVEYQGQRLPFYLSSGTAGKIYTKKGKWYPVLGMGMQTLANGQTQSSWINKPSDEVLAFYYTKPILEGLSQYLDETIGDVRAEIEEQMLEMYRRNNMTSKDLTKEEIEFFNKGLPEAPSNDPILGIPNENKKYLGQVNQKMVEGFKKQNGISKITSKVAQVKAKYDRDVARLDSDLKVIYDQIIQKQEQIDMVSETLEALKNEKAPKNKIVAFENKVAQLQKEKTDLEQKRQSMLDEAQNVPQQQMQQDLINLVDGEQEAPTPQQTQTPQEETQTPQEDIEQETPQVEETQEEEMQEPQLSIMEEAQIIAQQQNDMTYEQLERMYVDIRDNILPTLSKKNQKEFKMLLKILKTHEGIIRKDARSSHYVNHVSSAMLKALMRELSVILIRADRAQARTDLQLTIPEKQKVLNAINQAIFAAMKHMSNITSQRYVSENNPQGLIYAKFSHWFLREIMDADFSDPATLQMFNVLDDRGTFYRRIINAILNLEQEKGYEELLKAIDSFVIATDVKTVVDASLVEGDTQRTLEVTQRQWKRNAQRIERIKKRTGFKTYIPQTYNSLVDPYTYLTIQGLFDEQSWASVIYKKLVEGVKNQIEIDRVFEKTMNTEIWIKQNFRELKRMDKKKFVYRIENLSGANLTMSQVIFLRDMLAREIVRNRAIDLGIINGEKSEHFKEGYMIQILALVNDSIAKEEQAQKAKIVDPLELLRELDRLVEANPVAKELNKKVLDFFYEVYPYVNERYMEINGQILQSEGRKIKKTILTDSQKEGLYEGLPDSINEENIDRLYVPIYIGKSGYFVENNVSVQNILDLGVFDGMTQSIKEGASGMASVDSILNVLYKYKKEARNYYGLHRIMSDWTKLTRQKLKGEEQAINMQVYIGTQAITYVEELMKDMAGYKRATNTMSRRVMRQLKKNFYRYALAGNVKVIFTQLTTIWNLSLIYGNQATFFPKMYKNLFMQLSPKNKQILDDLRDTDNIYYDRTYNPTFDIGEASNEGLDGNAQFNRIIKFLMSGITITDNAINKAFYLTLLETVNPKTNKFYTESEAQDLLNQGIMRSQSSALDITKSPLLRTDNDLIQIFIKFMGEPLKLQSQIFLSTKQLRYIRGLNKKVRGKENVRVIDEYKDELTREEERAFTKYQMEKNKLDELQAKEDSPDFASLENYEQKQLRKEIAEQQSKTKDAKENYDEVKSMVDSTKKQMDDAILSQPKVKEDLIRKSAALMGATMYMAGLGVAFRAFVTNMGKLDDREEDEELFAYLARKYAVGLGGEFAGLFPLVRDLYGFIVDGWDLDTIDELGAIQSMANLIRTLIGKMVQGDEIKPLEIARDLALAGGNLIGLPTRNLEKFLIYAFMITGNQDDYYIYRTATGQRTSSNKELAQAIIDGDDDLVQAIVDTKIASRKVVVSEPVMNEIISLTRVGEDVFMNGIQDSYTIDGVEYKLEDGDEATFRSVYNQADLVIQKIILSPRYQMLNDEKKSSLLRSIYNYYLRLAKDTVFDTDLVPEAKKFRTLTESYNYFLSTVMESLYRTQLQEIAEQR